MKTLILTLTLIVYTVSLNAQDYAATKSSKLRTENKAVSFGQLNQFTSEVILDENFKYRDFLKESKNSNVSFHLDGKILTKVELAKLLRKSAVTSANYSEFQIFIENNYPQLMSIHSDKEMTLLYEKFRKGTLNTYIQNLAEDW